MKFRFKLIAVALVAILTVGIYHMGINNNEAIEEDQKQAYNKTESIYLWYIDENLTDYFTSAAVAFHEKNPDIRVIPELVTSEEYLEYISGASVEGEHFPDVFLLMNDSLEKAYLAGLASGVSDSEKVLNTAHFSQVALDAVTYHNNLVGYPLFFETSVLVYNKTYLNDWLKKVKEEGLTQETDDDMDMSEIDTNNYGSSENSTSNATEKESYNVETLTLEDLIPATIEDIKSFADEYDAPDGVDGVFKWDVSDIFYNYFFVGNYMIVGGPTGDSADNIDIYNDKTIECMNSYQNLNQFFSIDAETSTYDGMIEDFIDGKFVFSIATSDVITRLEDAEIELEKKREESRIEFEGNVKSWNALVSQGEMTEEERDKKIADAEDNIAESFEFGYARVPMLSDSLLSKSLSVTDAIVINGYSEHKAAANRFAAFVTTDYSERLYSKTKKIAASTDAGYSDQVLLLFQDEYANSIPMPKLIEASNFWVQLEIAFTKIWTGESIDNYLMKLSEQIVTQIKGTEYSESKTQ